MAVSPVPTSTLPGQLGNELAGRLLEAACAGAAALMGFWRGEVGRERKADGSFVSEADLAADAAVRQALERLGLETPLVSEEHAGEGGACEGTFLLLDPLDGTSEFLDRGAEFCVCLAAISHGRPVAGAIVAPALGKAWLAGDMAFAVDLDAAWRPTGARRPLHVRLRPQGPARLALVSRRHGDARSEVALKLCGATETRLASSAIKFGLLAEGIADLHVRHGRTMAWDIAAGDAILSAAGGRVAGLDGQPLRYDGGADGAFDNPAFAAVSDAALMEELLDAVRRAC